MALTQKTSRHEINIKEVMTGHQLLKSKREPTAGKGHVEVCNPSSRPLSRSFMSSSKTPTEKLEPCASWCRSCGSLRRTSTSSSTSNRVWSGFQDAIPLPEPLQRRYSARHLTQGALGTQLQLAQQPPQEHWNITFFESGVATWRFYSNLHSESNRVAPRSGFQEGVSAPSVFQGSSNFVDPRNSFIQK